MDEGNVGSVFDTEEWKVKRGRAAAAVVPKWIRKKINFWLFAQSNFDSSPYVNFFSSPNLHLHLFLMLRSANKNKLIYSHKMMAKNSRFEEDNGRYRHWGLSQFLLYRDINFLSFLCTLLSNRRRHRSSSTKFLSFVVVNLNNRVVDDWSIIQKGVIHNLLMSAYDDDN